MFAIIIKISKLVPLIYITTQFVNKAITAFFKLHTNIILLNAKN